MKILSFIKDKFKNKTVEKAAEQPTPENAAKADASAGQLGETPKLSPLAESDKSHAGRAFFDAQDELDVPLLIHHLREEKEHAAQAAEYFREARKYMDEKNLADGLKSMEKAADCGNAEAYYILGMMAMKGLGQPQDDDKAIRCLNEAANRGSANAFMELAKQSVLGKLNQDNARTLAHYALKLGCGDAARLLQALDRKEGKEPDTYPLPSTAEISVFRKLTKAERCFADAEQREAFQAQITPKLFHSALQALEANQLTRAGALLQYLRDIHNAEGCCLLGLLALEGPDKEPDAAAAVSLLEEGLLYEDGADCAFVLCVLYALGLREIQPDIPLAVSYGEQMLRLFTQKPALFQNHTSENQQLILLAGELVCNLAEKSDELNAAELLQLMDTLREVATEDDRRLPQAKELSALCYFPASLRDALMAAIEYKKGEHNYGKQI